MMLEAKGERLEACGGRHEAGGVRQRAGRPKRGAWRAVRISTLLKMEEMGWKWLVDPSKRNAPALRSPGGRVYDFKTVARATMVRERVEDLFMSDGD